MVRANSCSLLYLLIPPTCTVSVGPEGGCPRTGNFPSHECRERQRKRMAKPLILIAGAGLDGLPAC